MKRRPGWGVHTIAFRWIRSLWPVNVTGY
jgi:hypothetical protein